MSKQSTYSTLIEIHFTIFTTIKLTSSYILPQVAVAEVTCCALPQHTSLDDENREVLALVALGPKMMPKKEAEYEEEEGDEEDGQGSESEYILGLGGTVSF